LRDFEASLPEDGFFQVQLEGGEPTIHTDFWEFVRIAREHPRCAHLVVCTNGVVLPRTREKLHAWIARLGVPLTLKLSFNHYLRDHDPGLVNLAILLRDLFAEIADPAASDGSGDRDRLFVLNVRLRRGYEQDDASVREIVERAGLLSVANIFYLQRYGYATDQADWEPPAPVWDRFTLVNPDGRVFGPDLVARSEAMRTLG
jgi:hypothetical protein